MKIWVVYNRITDPTTGNSRCNKIWIVKAETREQATERVRSDDPTQSVDVVEFNDNITITVVYEE